MTQPTTTAEHTMTDKQNTPDEQVEAHLAKPGREPAADVEAHATPTTTNDDVEGHPYRRGSPSETPQDVEGHGIRPRIAPTEDVEGHATPPAANDDDVEGHPLRRG